MQQDQMQQDQAQATPFAWFVKQQRKEHDFTQQALATLACCSIDTIKKIEAGKLKPSRQLAELLASALSIEPQKWAIFVHWARSPHQASATLEEAAHELAQGAEGSVGQGSQGVAGSQAGQGADGAADQSVQAGQSAQDTQAAISLQRTNLPYATASFVGREKELGEIWSLLRRTDVRLLTLLGAPGIGKTRLAVQAAAGLLGDFDGGVYLVPLAPLADPALVVYTIAQVLGVPDIGSQPILESLKHALQERATLLVLDNFEHLLPAAHLVSDLLASASRLKVLVTSREKLHLYGECKFAVPPLKVPPVNPATPLTAAELAGYEAADLFMQRARLTGAVDIISDGNSRAIAEICFKLDGLPLAIELAAARAGSLLPEAMLQRLNSLFSFLTGGARDLPERQKTLRNTIDWSYRLLDEPCQKVFRRLAVFRGGCSLEAVEAVCDAAGLGIDVAQGLASLVSKSLLQEGGATAGQARFWLLETVREYAWERLSENCEGDETRELHAGYFRQLAERAEPHLRGPQQALWMDRVEADYGNIQAAFEWSQEESSRADEGLWMAGALLIFLETRAHISEWSNRLVPALAQPNLQGPTAGRAKALLAAGRFTWYSRDYSAAESLIIESLQISREIGDRVGTIFALEGLGLVKAQKDDPDGFTALYALLEESLQTRTEIGYMVGFAELMAFMLYRTVQYHEFARAEELYKQYLPALRALGDKRGLAVFLYGAGNLFSHRNNYRKAAHAFAESITLTQELHDKQGVAWCVAGLGELAAARGNMGLAALMFGLGAALLQAYGVELRDHPFHPAEFQEMMSAVQSCLGESAFHEAWQRGQALADKADGVDTAVAFALASLPQG
ncbi:MAG: helix-turn-helix domain-containing protein [Chloroflexota bacterium]|nr:helix-turn-helix domain-containing protein [Chloroflexota bacterium]